MSRFRSMIFGLSLLINFASATAVATTTAAATTTTAASATTTAAAATTTTAAATTTAAVATTTPAANTTTASVMTTNSDATTTTTDAMTTTDANYNNTCPCIGGGTIPALNDYISNTCNGLLLVDILSDGNHECYPLDYGSSCKAHDFDLPPICLTDGSLNPHAPVWCTDFWCYIDPNDCSDTSYADSSMFEDAFYSYDACGYGNSWAAYEHDPDRTVADLATLVNDYVTANVGELERTVASIVAGEYSDVTCDVTNSCDCTSCSTTNGWELTDVDKASTDYCPEQPAYSECLDILVNMNRITFTEHEADHSKMECLFPMLQHLTTSTAAVEYNDPTRIAYQYMGLQDSGNFFQWPAMQWCSASYDPRYRDWYISAASGPKDIVMVIDTSGSMGMSDRIELARQAAIKLVNTLIYADYASIVLFDDVEVHYSNELVPMNKQNKENMVEWIQQNAFPSGGTNFGVGLRKAFDILQYSQSQGSSSYCKGAVLFLTDGVDSSWTESDYVDIESRNNDDWDISIFSYTLGEGADPTIPKELACRNKGIYYHVGDGADLGSTMAGYYNYFAVGQTKNVGEDPVRWMEYKDWITDETLISGCQGVYDRSTQPVSLIGVFCMDINMIIPVKDLKSKSGYQDFESVIEAETRTCSRFFLSDGDIQYLRDDAGMTCGKSTSNNDLTTLFLVVGGAFLVIVAIGCYCCGFCDSKSTSSNDGGNASQNPRSPPPASVSNYQQSPPMSPNSQYAQTPMNPNFQYAQTQMNPNSQYAQTPMNPNSQYTQVPMNPNSQYTQVPMNPNSQYNYRP